MSDKKHVKISSIITLTDPPNPTITIVLEMATIRRQKCVMGQAFSLYCQPSAAQRLEKDRKCGPATRLQYHVEEEVLVEANNLLLAEAVEFRISDM